MALFFTFFMVSGLRKEKKLMFDKDVEWVVILFMMAYVAQLISTIGETLWK